MSIFKDNRTFDQISPDFMTEKAIELSRRTVIGYHTKVLCFSAWLSAQGLSGIPIRKISSETMSRFFVFLSNDKNLDKPTVEKYFLHLRKLWQYCQKRNIVEKLPFDLLVMPQKKTDKSAMVIPQNDLTTLLTVIKEKDKQLYLACMVQYYCFIRPGGELRLMKVGDIDFENGVIKIPMLVAKNRSTEIVTMPQQLIDIFIEYGIDKADRELFVFGKSKQPDTMPSSVNMLRYRFNIVRDSLGMNKGYKLYSFKHTGASRLHASGISLRELMDQLRHTKLDATQHYVKKHAGIINTRIRDNFPCPF